MPQCLWRVALLLLVTKSSLASVGKCPLELRVELGKRSHHLFAAEGMGFQLPLGPILAIKSEVLKVVSEGSLPELVEAAGGPSEPQKSREQWAETFLDRLSDLSERRYLYNLREYLNLSQEVFTKAMWQVAMDFNPDWIPKESIWLTHPQFPNYLFRPSSERRQINVLGRVMVFFGQEGEFLSPHNLVFMRLSEGGIRGVGDVRVFDRAHPEFSSQSIIYQAEVWDMSPRTPENF